MQQQNKVIKMNPVLKEFEIMINKIKQEKIDLEKALIDKENQLKLLEEARDKFKNEE